MGMGALQNAPERKNHIDHPPKRGWLMWFFALELNCHEKL